MAVQTDFLKLSSTVFVEENLKSSSYDGVLLITYPQNFNVKAPKVLQTTVENAFALDKALDSVCIFKFSHCKIVMMFYGLD